MKGVTLGLLCVAVSMFAAGAGERASARPEKGEVSARLQTLFKCRTDRLFTLRASDDGTSEQSYAVSSRQDEQGEVRLTVDANSSAMTLFIRIGGKPIHSYILRDVEQGSSLGSGASGRADTDIRGKSGGNIFTLFAEYDNEGFDHDAALQVEGSEAVLIACDGSQYSAPTAKGLGRFGFTNIYRLSADGLAKEMEVLPVEPDLDRHPEAAKRSMDGR